VSLRCRRPRRSTRSGPPAPKNGASPQPPTRLSFLLFRGGYQSGASGQKRPAKQQPTAGTAYAAPAILLCYEPPIVSLRLWVSMCASPISFCSKVLLGFLSGDKHPIGLTATRAKPALRMKAAYRLEVNGQKPRSTGKQVPGFTGGHAPSFQQQGLSAPAADLNQTRLYRVDLWVVAVHHKEPPSTATIMPANIAIMQLLIRERRTVLIYFRRQLLIRLRHNAKQLPIKCLPR